MASQICGLEGQHSVTCGVCLHKAVACKGTHHIPDCIDCNAVHSFCASAFFKDWPISFELMVCILLGENFAYPIGFSHAQARQRNSGLRHILLIARNAIALIEKSCKKRMDRFPWLSMESFDVFVDISIRRRSNNR